MLTHASCDSVIWLVTPELCFVSNAHLCFEYHIQKQNIKFAIPQYCMCNAKIILTTKVISYNFESYLKIFFKLSKSFLFISDKFLETQEKLVGYFSRLCYFSSFGEYACIIGSHQSTSVSLEFKSWGENLRTFGRKDVSLFHYCLG